MARAAVNHATYTDKTCCNDKSFSNNSASNIQSLIYVKVQIKAPSLFQSLNSTLYVVVKPYRLIISPDVRNSFSAEYTLKQLHD